MFNNPSNKPERAMPRSYSILVPDNPFLFPSMDLNIRWLEAVRLALPSIFGELPVTVEYDLFLIHGPYTPDGSEPGYPVFGVHCPNEEALAAVTALDYWEMNERVNNWITRLEPAELIQRAYFIDYVDLALLRSQKVYPIR